MRVEDDVVVTTFAAVADAVAVGREFTSSGAAAAVHFGAVTACNGEAGLEYCGRAVDAAMALVRG